MQKDVPFKWYYNKNVIIYTDINNNLISLTYIGDPGFALGCKKKQIL